MMTLVFAVLAAAANAWSSVLQRAAARQVETHKAFSIRLVVVLLRKPVWLFGVGSLICGFVFQALALRRGSLALVQPILVAELPFTLIFAGLYFRGRAGGRAMAGALGMSGGLALILASASPSGGTDSAGAVAMVFAVAVIAGIVAVLIGVAIRASGGVRASVLGAAAGAGFGMSAALMKQAADQLDKGAATPFTSWPLYAMAVIGVASLFIWQNALQAGSLVAAQPSITLADPVVSVVLGVWLYHENIRLGLWLLPELAGVLVIVLSSIELARSPLVSGSSDVTPHPVSRDTAGSDAA